MQAIFERASRIKIVIFDVDGVLTDGCIYLGNDGEELKAFNAKDGLGMKLLRDTGIEIGIITGLSSQIVASRMEKLGIQHIYQGQTNKLPAYQELITRLNLSPEQVAYVGDDIVDLPIMRRVGLAVAVRDAHKRVKEVAHWQTKADGGRGAAREVCDLLMEANGTLQGVLERYL